MNWAVGKLISDDFDDPSEKIYIAMKVISAIAIMDTSPSEKIVKALLPPAVDDSRGWSDNPNPIGAGA